MRFYNRREVKEVKNNKYTTRQGLDKLGRYRQYFVAGHSRWFQFIIGLTQFGLIFYNFLWIKLPFIPEIMKTELIFFPFWFGLYIPLATMFGYWDLRKGTFKAETNVSLEVNPIWQRLFRELGEIRTEVDEITMKLEEK